MANFARPLKQVPVVNLISRQDPELSLKGRFCVISGASRGIGLAIAQRFAFNGASCCILGRNEETLGEALDSLKRTPGAVHSFRVGDVKSRDFWKGLNDELEDVDVLVNAAGITHQSLLVTTSAKTIGEVLDTNLKGPIWACQMFTKQMLRRKTGCIINIGSLLGIKGGQGSVAYAASKAGLIGLTRALAAELARSNIRVNAILPGYIWTPMTAAMNSTSRELALKAIPSRKFGTPDSIADAAVFLVTNPYANNCVMNLDGGLSAT